MPARLKIKLTESEEQELLELSRDNKITERTWIRAEILRLNARGWKVKEIAFWVNWSENTIRKTISKWLFEGNVGLWDKPRTGRKKTWKEEELKYIEERAQQNVWF